MTPSRLKTKDAVNSTALAPKHRELRTFDFSLPSKQKHLASDQTQASKNETQNMGLSENWFPHSIHW